MAQAEAVKQFDTVKGCRPPYAHYFAMVPGVCQCGARSIGQDGKTENVKAERERTAASTR